MKKKKKERSDIYRKSSGAAFCIDESDSTRRIKGRFDRARVRDSRDGYYHSPRANSPPNPIPTVAIYSSRRQPADRRAVSRSMERTLNRTLWAERSSHRMVSQGRIRSCIRLRQRGDACRRRDASLLFLRLVIFEQMRAIMTSLPTSNAAQCRVYAEVRTGARASWKVETSPSLSCLPVCQRAPVSSTSIVLFSLTMPKKATPGTSLRILCRFSNDLKYRSLGRIRGPSSHDAAY